MLVHVHGMWARARITTSNIVPDSSSARCKPDIESIKEDPVWIVRVHCDSLVVPVLWIIPLATTTVCQRTALRAGHVAPGRTAVRASPGAKLAAVGIAAAAVAIWSNRLALCINEVRVAWRDSNINPPQLIACRGIDKRVASTGIHWRTSRVGAAGDLSAEYETIRVAGN